MYTKRDGSAVLSSIVFLAIMSILAVCLFKVSHYNMEIQSMNDFEMDVYDMSSGEEKVLKSFMNELNSDSEKEVLFDNDFKKEDKGNILKYYKDEDKLILNYMKDDKTIRERKLYYEFKDKNIILIPSYTFYQ